MHRLLFIAVVCVSLPVSAILLLGAVLLVADALWEPAVPPTLADPDTGLLAHITFDDAAGHPIERRDGGQSRHFDGVDDAVLVSGFELPSRDFSITAWVNPSSIEPMAILTARAPDRAGANALALGIAHSLILAVDDAATLGDAPIAPGQWTHIAATRFGPTVTLYVDGVVDYVSRDPTRLDFGDCEHLVIGASADVGCTGSLSHFFSGSLDDIRIYDRALSPTEVSALCGRGFSVSEEQASGSLPD